MINAPISLIPTPFPANAFRDAVRIQPLYNQLVHDISQDDAFLKEIMERYVFDRDSETDALTQMVFLATPSILLIWFSLAQR